MMRWNAVLFATLAAALLVDTVPAAAQGGFRLYPWCAYYGGGRGGASNCYFSTFEQCQAAVSGAGGSCNINTWYAAYGPYYSFGGAAPPRGKHRRRR